MPKLKIPSIGALDGLKDKLGFAQEDEERFDAAYDSGYDTGYDDMRSDERFDDGYDSGRFDDVRYNGDFREKDAFGGFDSFDERGGYSVPPISGEASVRVRPVDTERRTYSASSPKLVTIDDVKAHTAIPEGVIRDPMERIRQRRADARSGVRGASAVHKAIESRDGREDYVMDDVSDMGAATLPFEEDSRVSTAFDRTDTRSAASYAPQTSTYQRGRNFGVVRPFSYEEAEQVAKTLRRGDSVVLNLSSTESGLSKRILDFSFGAASMVDANVECIAAQVFALTQGDKMTMEEMDSLRSQGII